MKRVATLLSGGLLALGTVLSVPSLAGASFPGDGTSLCPPPPTSGYGCEFRVFQGPPGNNARRFILFHNDAVVGTAEVGRTPTGRRYANVCSSGFGGQVVHVRLHQDGTSIVHDYTPGGLGVCANWTITYPVRKFRATVATVYGTPWALPPF